MKSFGIIMVLSIFMLMVGNLGGIGYGLYLWGGTGMTFALAAWTAFKFWVIWVTIGFILFLTSLYISKEF